MLNNFFFTGVSRFVCYFSGFINYLIWSFSRLLYCFGNSFLCIEIANKTNNPVFKSVAGIKLELIWLLIFCLYNIFFVTFW